jgi:protein-S-isoprenylcysteine O-methyltransferase Ste14
VKSIQHLFFRYRNWLAGLPILYSCASTRWTWDHDLVVWPTALCLVVTGVALRAWSACYNRYGQVQRSRRALAVSGPYALMRNPLYAGNALIVASGVMASELVWLVPIATLWALLVYSQAVRHEEERLQERYGEEFARYRGQVHRWLPRVNRFRTEAARPSARFDRALLAQSYCLLILLPFGLKEFIGSGLTP